MLTYMLSLQAEEFDWDSDRFPLSPKKCPCESSILTPSQVTNLGPECERELGAFFSPYLSRRVPAVGGRKTPVLLMSLVQEND